MKTALRLPAAVATILLCRFGGVAQDQPPYSLEKERQLGRQLASEVAERTNLIDDSVVLGYVNGVARRLSEYCPYRLPIEVRMAAVDQMNGSALPGGYLYLNTGAIIRSENEAELAGVLAHLIAHLRAGGLGRTSQRGTLTNWLDIPLIFMGPGNGYSFLPSGAGLAIPRSLLEAYRGLAFQADEGGLRCLYEAGYDPEAFVAGLKTLPPDAARDSTHPPLPERVERLQALVASFEPQPGAVTNTPQFNEMKQRVASIYREPPRRAEAPPTLRRK